jgi:hypothetical protein
VIYSGGWRIGFTDNGGFGWMDNAQCYIL